METKNFRVPLDELAVNDLKKLLRGEVDKAARISVRLEIIEHTWHMVHRTGDPVASALEKLRDIERWVMGDDQPKEDVSVKLGNGDEAVVRKGEEELKTGLTAGLYRLPGDALEGVPCTE